MRRQEQVLTVIAFVLLAGVILYHALSSPLRYEPAVEGEGVTTETVVSTTAVSLSVTASEPYDSTTSGTLSEQPSEASVTASPGIDSSGRVNLNTATIEDLMTLKGIGEAKAQTIVDDRTENGPFSSVDDLTRVSGIGQKTLDNIRDQITV